MKIEEIKLVERRGSGTSEGQILEGLGKALQNPGVSIKVIDHAVDTRRRTEILIKNTARMVECLGLNDISLDIDLEHHMTITNCHSGRYMTDDLRCFKEIT